VETEVQKFRDEYGRVPVNSARTSNENPSSRWGGRVEKECWRISSRLRWTEISFQRIYGEHCSPDPKIFPTQSRFTNIPTTPHWRRWSGGPKSWGYIPLPIYRGYTPANESIGRGIEGRKGGNSSKIFRIVGAKRDPGWKNLTPPIIYWGEGIHQGVDWKIIIDWS
jgi:hypothetical protein